MQRWCFQKNRAQYYYGILKNKGRQVLEGWEAAQRRDGGNHCGTEESRGGEGQ
jgi:hypothetical protein